MQMILNVDITTYIYAHRHIVKFIQKIKYKKNECLILKCSIICRYIVERKIIILYICIYSICMHAYASYVTVNSRSYIDILYIVLIRNIGIFFIYILQ